MKVINGVLTKVTNKDLELLKSNPTEFWKGVHTIGDYAFWFLYNLTELTIPNTVKHIHRDAIYACKNLKLVRFNKELDLSDLNYIFLFKYLRQENGYFVIDTEKKNATDIKLQYNAEIVKLYSKFYHNREIMNVINDTNPAKREFFIELYYAVGEEKFKTIIPTLNFSYFDRLAKKFSRKSTSSLMLKMKFLYNLGGLSKPIAVSRVSKTGNVIVERVDYAQKACEFFRERFEHYFDEEFMEIWARHMNFDGLNTEFSNFILKLVNFNKMYDFACENEKFIAECYNKFYEIQKSNTSNKGSQRQLAPTVEHFLRYFKAKISPNMYKGHEELVDAVTDYFFDTETIDLAIEIDEERKKLNVNNHILSTPLKEETFLTKLNKLDNIITKCEKVNTEAMKTLVNIANKKFTYEWLDKSVPENFILGKLCDCCAHLKGAGAGIMEKSILDQNVQNLVMKNASNQIIAKATMYINKEEKYAVFNNAEVSFSIIKRDKPEVYKAFMRGVYAFVKQYNKENPEKELKIVTIGMSGLNDLMEEIKTYNEKSKTLYKAIDYRNIDRNWTYRGDSNYEQYVLYEKDNPYYEELEKNF